MPTVNPINIGDFGTGIFSKEVWDLAVPYESIKQDALLRSPLVQIMQSSGLDLGGILANETFAKRVSGRAGKPIAKTAIDVDQVGQARDAYVAISRLKAWGQEMLAKQIMGKDLLVEVAKQAPQFWSNEWQSEILDMLYGIFEGPLKATHRLDEKTYDMSWSVIKAGTALLGDKQKEFTTILMHSKQFDNLEAEGLIKYRTAGELGYNILVKGEFPMVKGLPIIMSDDVPVDEVTDSITGEKSYYYHSYIGKAGIIKFRNISFNNEYFRTSTGGGTDELVQMARTTMRIPGVKFNLAAASDAVNPENTDFRNPLCWSLADSITTKDIPIVEVITKASAVKE